MVERLRENFEDGPQQAGADPVLKSSVAGLIRRIAVRQVGPGSRGPQNPEDAVEHGAVLPPGTPSSVWPARQLWHEGPVKVPLLVGEVTRMTRSDVGHPDSMVPPLSGLPKRRLLGIQST